MRKLLRSMSSFGRQSFDGEISETSENDKDRDAASHAKLNWALVRKAAGNLSRDHFLSEVLKDPDHPNAHHILRLGQILLEEAFRASKFDLFLFLQFVSCTLHSI